MIERLKNMGSFFTYIASAMIALLMASWISTMFIPKAVSQTPNAPAPRPPPSAVAPPPPGMGATDAPGVPGGAAATTAVVPGSSPSAPQVVAQPGSLVPPLGAKASANPLADIIEDYNYVAKDRRDPFMPFERPTSVTGMVGPLWPLQGYDLDQLKLVGIIWDVKNPKAMIMDPSGKGYVVRVNERIGRSNGYIARIREGEIVIVESVVGLDGKINYATKLIKLQND